MRTTALLLTVGALTGCAQATPIAREEGGEGGGTDPADLVEAGDCSSDADCGEGRCVRVPDRPGGYWTCAAPRRFPDRGEPLPGSECGRPEDCEDGGLRCGCYPEGLGDSPVASMSASPPFVCMCDPCEGDEDCGEWRLCVPAGAWTHVFDERTRGLATCRETECSVNSDCTAGPEPLCVPYAPCGDETLWTVKVCSYADDECHADADCDGGICVRRGGRFACVPELRGCWG